MNDQGSNVLQMINSAEASIEAALYLIEAPSPTAALMVKAYDLAGDAINATTRAYWRHIGRSFSRDQDSHIQTLREVSRMLRRGGLLAPDFDTMSAIVSARNFSLHEGVASSSSADLSMAAVQTAREYLDVIPRVTRAS